MQPRSHLRVPSAGFLALRQTPPSLRPLVRAYLLGYASSVAPRLLTLLLQAVTRARRRASSPAAASPKKEVDLLASLRHIILTGFEWQRFPTFCAVLVGGSTLLETPIRRLLERLTQGLGQVSLTRLSRWLSAFVAAWLSLRLLQTKKSAAFTDKVPVKHEGTSPPGEAATETISYAGKTLDLTLFAVCRAVDVLVGELWARRRARRKANQEWTQLETLVTRSTDPWIFVSSVALIMWAWFYTPSRLPQGYRKWIASAANVDSRLIEALQECRSGNIRYGTDTGYAPLLQDMCEEYSWPPAWGDPAKSVPFPCEMVHMGCGPSCEYHALSRLASSFRWSMAMYLPLNLAMQLRKPPTTKGVTKAFLSAARSSAFLGTFITLFYYGVCLARTRVGPHILGTHTAARQTIDSGLCVGCGCFLCGWSVLIETASRRKDMALFVAPRALATLFPRRYAEDKQWRETIAFAASTAVVFTCAQENKDRVRGVMGKILGMVLQR
ncbi:integral membrane protein [Plectosphaerella plurivora]|uniref:Integral membrane protein n=1 Tax=Plectosphaerella plurivora TaxID=936078 RepID=A0A9P8V527_9PEZI|nr:integral membrane protein [Plectosphaerella plurivora]